MGRKLKRCFKNVVDFEGSDIQGECEQAQVRQMLLVTRGWIL